MEDLLNKLKPLSTNEEFIILQEVIIECIGTIKCGCVMDEETRERADFMTRYCKEFIEAWQNRNE